MSVLITQRYEADEKGLRFHVLRNSPTLEDYFFDVGWEEVEAVAALRNEFEDGGIHNCIEIYTRDASYDASDHANAEGWSEIASALSRHLDLLLPDWPERLETLETTKCLPVWKDEYADTPLDPGQRLLVFLRGTELPPMLLGECEQCGSTYEFVNWPQRS